MRRAGPQTGPRASPSRRVFIGQGGGARSDLAQAPDGRTRPRRRRGPRRRIRSRLPRVCRKPATLRRGGRDRRHSGIRSSAGRRAQLARCRCSSASQRESRRRGGTGLPHSGSFRQHPTNSGRKRRLRAATTLNPRSRTATSIHIAVQDALQTAISIHVAICDDGMGERFAGHLSPRQRAAVAPLADRGQLRRLPWSRTYGRAGGCWTSAVARAPSPPTSPDGWHPAPWWASTTTRHRSARPAPRRSATACPTSPSPTCTSWTSRTPRSTSCTPTRSCNTWRTPSRHCARCAGCAPRTGSSPPGTPASTYPLGGPHR